ncbi:hypothetical protein BC936DRAFT_141433 [Jimgerdemannia flammicorona]|uniref:Uncharacterized protein n=2 Tax=Jimgerdemannia flammicorona TaxID=994334 RepID=A0A433DG57_9FUNG|nr:hypothetical protein BC936DRAFT_141433 [Jimgerdemannia flammicorona]RUS32402.1 hypothetical protein BC938DRAFT_475494 [Jimgerdemannia flammicorona]
MALLTSIAGFATLGFAVRAYTLGLQKRPIIEGISSHFAMATAFGVFGYYIHGVQERQFADIQLKKKALLESRAKTEVASE